MTEEFNGYFFQKRFLWLSFVNSELTRKYRLVRIRMEKPATALKIRVLRSFGCEMSWKYRICPHSHVFDNKMTCSSLNRLKKVINNEKMNGFYEQSINKTNVIKTNKKKFLKIGLTLISGSSRNVLQSNVTKSMFTSA